MARRMVENGFSQLKMFGKYYLRFKSIYGNDAMAFMYSGASLGARNLHYEKYRKVRFAVSGIAKELKVYGVANGIVQAVVMFLTKHAERGKITPELVEAVIKSQDLDNLKVGAHTAGDVVRKYFGISGGITPAPITPPAPPTPSA